MMHSDFDQQPDAPGAFPRNLRSELSGDFSASKGRPLQVGVIEYHNEDHKSHASGAVMQVVERIQLSQPGVQRRRRPSPTMWRLTLLLGDSALLVASLLLALMLRVQLELNVAGHPVGTISSNMVGACLALLSWGLAVSVTNAQELKHAGSRLKSPLYALLTLALTMVLWTLLISPFLVGKTPFLSFMLSFFALEATALTTWRIVLAQIMGLPRFRQQAVIVGANAAGAIIAAELRKAKRPAAEVLGYISEDAGEQILREEDEWPILGDKKTLRSLARQGSIDMIIMAIDYKENPDLFQEALEAAQLGISVVPMARVYENTCGKIPVEYIGDQWFVTLPAEPVISPLYLCWRKTLDMLFGLFGLLALILLFPIVALAIYLDSPGPIFYSQERLGYRGQPFQVLKFRSMRLDAERPGQAVWAKKHDQRVTRVGRFLRATHLDELPQILNILRGEMTLIGPRPERQVFVDQLEKTIPFYRCRLSVKPGLTGWAQVKYPYTNSGHEALIKLQYDLYYIKHQSLTLDLLIMLKTVVEVLLCHGR